MSSPPQAYHADPEVLKRHVSFATMPESKQQSKIKVVTEASALMKDYALMPAERPTRDQCFATFFWITLLSMILLAYNGFKHAGADAAHSQTFQDPDYGRGDMLMLAAVGGQPELGLLPILQSMACAAVGAAVAAMAFMYVAKEYPTYTVYACTIAVGVLVMALGVVAMMGGDNPLYGALMILLGVFNICALCTCWAKYVPFTIELLRIIATVVSQHPRMYFVALFGATCSIVWVLLSVFAFFGLASFAGSNAYVLFLYVFVLSWGTLVCAMVPHTTYCGVFARWYFADAPGLESTAGGPTTSLLASSDVVSPSLKVACGSSFGSICYGSALVAVTRALAALARDNRQSSSDNNIVCGIILLVVQCIVSCIGDMIEYMNDWAYVQCAIRGCGYQDAAKITYALCTCANVKYVISDALLGTVSAGGSLLVMAAGAVSGYAMGVGSADPSVAATGATFGALVGFIAASGTVGIFQSASKTLLVCWAEDPAPMEVRDKALEVQFREKVEAKLTPKLQSMD
eukprot:TRINITY_DN28628_c0_g1_i1.p1 TRINITY_DN28628_c0_g1~~TRINITY_DN28628_c0_g1_i1.p1  ORF type:complete len:517 (-),score=84.47 TRINITY_DN28628_c0_g1_i1:128-1678(-)